MEDGVELYLRHPDAHKQNIEFERLNGCMRHERCSVCRQVSTSLEVLQTYHMCRSCRAQVLKSADYIPGWLPTWVDSHGYKQFVVPDCLRVLREGEKLLIQRVSTYVPLRYLKGGAHGSRGHVCCFPKKISDFVNELPRKNVEAIKIIRRVVSDEKTIQDSTFMIRKSVVLKALLWLKEHNIHYRDIVINKDNLQWMGTKQEMELPVNVIYDDIDAKERETNLREDRPNLSTEIPCYGIVEHDNFSDLPKRKDEDTAQTIRCLQEQRAESLSKENNLDEESRKDRNIMNFPEIGINAVDEYDDSIRIFCLAFPWLFPGGVGDWADIKTSENLTVEEWAKKLLYYEDGRFAKDKIWCFYALNYTSRRSNMKQGDFFVKRFAGQDQPQTLEELQERIRNGDNSWIDKICYFGNTVKGSTPYWRQRRDEIHSWINFHVAKGNGAPTMFLTLSCAEHYWPDVKNLLNDRRTFEDGFSEGKSEAAFVHAYTLVIQEYFQKRVKNWFDTVGKRVFKVKHYWLRFEFAPGRGQIHAHCLLILDNMTMQKEAYDAKERADALRRAAESDISVEMEMERAQLYKEWLEKELCMTTSIPERFNSRSYKPLVENSQHPASTNLKDISTELLDEDGTKLLMTVQNHCCTDYCLRKRKRL